MPIGSAASLPGSLPQAPLHPFPMARRSRPSPLVAWSSGAAAPPRLLPLQKAADDPPRGRILVVENDAAAALGLQGLLQDAGYRVVGPAGCAEEAVRLIERGHGQPITCAMLSADVADVGPLADRLEALSIPYIWVSEAANAILPAVHAYAPLLRKPFGRGELLEALDEATRQGAGRRCYAIPPPQPVWPRVFPQL